MIARLRGLIWEKEPNRLVLDVGGVGYELAISSVTAGYLGDEGDTAELLVSTQVREDSIHLYGFARPDERMVFELLLSVSGIGPKTALGALSSVTAGDMVAAVSNDDVARLTRIPGVGKKTAERLIVELRDRIDQLRVSLGAAVPEGGSPRGDALAALVALGYPRAQAERALQGLSGAEATVQEMIKAALQKLSGAR